jgi:acid phosphatase (class A)
VNRFLAPLTATLLSATILAGCAATSPGPTPTAGAAAAGPAPTTLKGYLATNPLNGAMILGPPPAPGSAHDRADRALYEETRALEGSARWKTAIQDNDLWGGGAVRRFSCALGQELNETQTPVTLRILHRIELDGRTVGTPPKDHYARVRPALGNDKPVCVPRADWMRTNASYPSGHSMVAWAWALVLTELAPARADALLTLGRESGESRMICGVHYISDVEAGRTLGAGMLARLRSEPEFRADLEAARAEMTKPGKTPPGCDT